MAFTHDGGRSGGGPFGSVPRGDTADCRGLLPHALEGGVRQADPEGRFVWQNMAAEALSEARENYPDPEVLVFSCRAGGPETFSFPVSVSGECGNAVSGFGVLWSAYTCSQER